MSAEPLLSQKKMPSDDVPRQMVTLLVELLRSGELPALAIGGAWSGVNNCLTGRPGLASLAMELGLIDLAAEHLRAIGSAADLVSISRGKAGRGIMVLWSFCSGPIKAFAGQAERPDLAACVASGLFDICVEIVVAFAAAGLDGLRDTNHGILVMALVLLAKFGTQPGCEAKIRGAATALGFCLESSLDMMEEIGFTVGACAARVCCSVFGRDEGGSEFAFTQHHIDLLTTQWSQSVRAIGFSATVKPTADNIFALEMCISDKNKPLLLANKDFVPYLVDALLLDPEHPRAGVKEELKIWCQQHHIECLAQLAVYEPAREALLAYPAVIPSLRAVSEAGLSAEARELAGAALLALSDKKLEVVTEGQMHVMLSYQWDFQAIVQRINDSLITRGYVTWYDLTNMRGSTMDAMR